MIWYDMAGTPGIYFNSELILSLSRYCCIVNTRVIIAFINSSLYSYETYTQVKEMDNLNLFIDSHYKYTVSIIRVKHILTLHLSTANWRIKLTTGCCCKNVAARYVILPGRVNTTVPRVVAYFNAPWVRSNFTLLYRNATTYGIKFFHRVCVHGCQSGSFSNWFFTKEMRIWPYLVRKQIIHHFMVEQFCVNKPLWLLT